MGGVNADADSLGTANVLISNWMDNKRGLRDAFRNWVVQNAA